MQISEFSRRTGLSQDTIRFYVRKGLLVPRMGSRGGRNPYQQFSERDVSLASMIRFAQSLGMPLKEIAEVARELLQTDIAPAREMEILATQLARLEQKAAELAHLTRYLRAKHDWIARGRPGDEPHFSGDVDCLAPLALPPHSAAPPKTNAPPAPGPAAAPGPGTTPPHRPGSHSGGGS